MSLNGSLYIGRSAMLASQAALQIAGHNMANAATPGYHRQSVHMAPLYGSSVGRGLYVGQGVQISAIRREIDTALQARYRDSLSQEGGAGIEYRFLSTIESIQNELTDNDLSSALSDFFNAFSELANNPEDAAIRSIVIQEGQSIAGRIADMRTQYNGLAEEIEQSLHNSVSVANDLLDQIALINVQIVDSGAGGAGSLMDQRDLLIDELSQYIDITVLPHDNGVVDIQIGSIPVVLAGQSRGIALQVENSGEMTEISLRVASDGTTLQAGTGAIGSLMTQRTETVLPAIETLETFARELIFNVNRIHSQGQGQQGWEQVTGTYGVTDPTVPLAISDLPFSFGAGSFQLHVIDQATGIAQTVQVAIDPATMSMEDVAAAINAEAGEFGVVAAVGTGGVLTIEAATGTELTFSDDTSGVLAALGVNTFFDGVSATTMSVHDAIAADPSMLAAGGNNEPGSTATAVLLAALQEESISGLGNVSLREYWQSSVSGLAIRTQSALNSAETAGLVRSNLFAQAQSVSGVSLDEESINLITWERQFQAAARFISVIDETLEILMSLP